MKIQKFKSLLLLGVFLSITGTWAYAGELKKEYHEEFDANENTTLILRNKYGSIDVQNWDMQKIKIDVEVIVNHSSEDRAQKMLDYIDVRFSTSGNEVKAETQIDEKFSNSGNWKNGNEFEINYTVQMPKEINLDLFNKYGHVYIDEVAGLANIEVKYGKLKAGKLSRGNIKPLNTVSLAYANDCSITEVNWLKANIKYSGLEIEKAKAFVGYTSYMKLSIDQASSVVIEGKYDGYTFGKLSNLVVNTSYSNIKADELSKKLEADTKYTNVNIGYMPASFEGIRIDSKYGTYKIGLDDNASYNLEGDAGYSKIYHHDGGKVSRIQENTSMKVYGTVGSQSDPAANVKVITKYGNVKLNE
ncbi:hypothetical protein ACFLSP_00585 [Bacteroidota bacterium]